VAMGLHRSASHPSGGSAMEDLIYSTGVNMEDHSWRLTDWESSALFKLCDCFGLSCVVERTGRSIIYTIKYGHGGSSTSTGMDSGAWLVVDRFLKQAAEQPYRGYPLYLWACGCTWVLTVSPGKEATPEAPEIQVVDPTTFEEGEG
jgi:hypothetical protein